MTTKIPNERFPIYHFDKDLKEIYFRIDTEDTYQILLVPPTTSYKEFPPCSIVIASEGLEEFLPLCSIQPGECIRLTKVNHKTFFKSLSLSKYSRGILTLF
jgi:hypothetical protein